MLISFEELFGRLLEGIEAACEGESDRQGRARAMAHATAELLVGDPPTPRLLSIEILACGERGVRAPQQAIEGGGEPPLPDPAWAIAAAIFNPGSR